MQRKLAMDRDAAQRAKEAAWDAANDRALKREKQLYALQVPAGNIFPMGTEKPILTREDRRNFWKVIRMGRSRKKAGRPGGK